MESRAVAFSLLLLSLAPMLLAATYLLRPYRGARDLAREFAGLDDATAVGMLLDLWPFEDAGLRALVVESLVERLPRLQASDSDKLTPAHHARLLAFLKTPYAHVLHTDIGDLVRRRPNPMVGLQIAILKAFEQIGKPDAVPVVRRLATEIVVMAPARRVRAAAVECLPFLLARAEQAHAAQTLLRASAPHAPADAHLLRPAAPALASDAHLLRPGGQAAGGRQ